MGEDDELREELDAVLKLDNETDDDDNATCKIVTPARARKHSRPKSSGRSRSVPDTTLPSSGLQAAINLIESELDNALAQAND